MDDKNKQEREAFEAWYDTQWQNNGDTTSEAAWMARAALSQPQAGSTLSDAEIQSIWRQTYPKAVHGAPLEFARAILARSTEPAPKKDFLNGWREAIEQLPVSREPAPAPAAQAGSVPGGTVHAANLYEQVLQKAIDMGYANVSAALEDAAKWRSRAAPADAASEEKCAHEYRVEPPYGMRCKTCGQFQDDEKSTTPAPTTQADEKMPVKYYKDGGVTYAVYGSSSIDYVNLLLARQQAAIPGVPVAEVAAGNLGKRLMWHTEDAKSLTPVGTLLYATPAECADQFERIDMENHRLRQGMKKLMARLTTLLDEDQFADCESIVKGVGVEPPADTASEAVWTAIRRLERGYNPWMIADELRAAMSNQAQKGGADNG
ncbi:hypothetical protein DFLDMN_001532 [Cupriavidus sp. H19C3]|uniref:hypothetical protein n=1 Tax=Cupriavidus sp. H19C3 TaxID=3241603 RepID=UPI003BF78990